MRKSKAQTSKSESQPLLQVSDIKMIFHRFLRRRQQEVLDGSRESHPDQLIRSQKLGSATRVQDLDSEDSLVEERERVSDGTLL
jgi:hypothetical protein